MHMGMLAHAILHATVAGVIGFFVLFAASKAEGIVKFVGTCAVNRVRHPAAATPVPALPRASSNSSARSWAGGSGSSRCSRSSASSCAR